MNKRIMPSNSIANGDTIAEVMAGGYVEGAYDVLPLFFPDTKMSLEPFYRYEYLDTQKKVAPVLDKVPGRNRYIHVVGLSFKPHPQVVLKLDYRNKSAEDGTPIPDEVQFGVGYIF